MSAAPRMTVPAAGSVSQAAASAAPQGRPWRLLLSSVFQPFCVPGPYDAPDNMIEHGLFHRSFTGYQGMFTIQEQQHTYPLHLLAHNVDAHVTVLDYPTEAAFVEELKQGYDWVGISCVVSTLSKAQRLCALVREHAPRTRTLVGGAGAMAIGELVAPFSDAVCRGDGVRYLRELVGQDPEARVRFPIMPIFHGHNRMLGLPFVGHNFPVAVGLGCHRMCAFCSTSHQFQGKYVPMFDSGAELFDYFQQVQRHEEAAGRHHTHLSFLVYDENFLTNRPFVEQLRPLMREQALTDTPYQMFVFSDARVLSTYSVEELLELGVDTLWIGVESPSLDAYSKAHAVDVPRLIADYSAAGIKVFASMIAGLEGHTEELIRRDIEHALRLPTIGVQYMPVNPIPGTAYYSELKAKGLLREERDLTWYNMSHYNVRHPELSEAQVLGLLKEFYEREHELNGPLVLRFLQGRWKGYLRFHDSPSPYLRARTRVYARDLLRGIPVILAGELFGPSPRTRDAFRDLRRQLQGRFGRVAVLTDLLRGRLSGVDGGAYLFLGLPGVRHLMRRLLRTHAALRDPRTGSVLELLWSRRRVLRRSQRGRVPWGQPETVRTEYGGCG